MSRHLTSIGKRLRGTTKEMSHYEDTAAHPASVDCALLLLISSIEFCLLIRQRTKFISVWYGFWYFPEILLIGKFFSWEREIFSGPGKIESR